MRTSDSSSTRGRSTSRILKLNRRAGVLRRPSGHSPRAVQNLKMSSQSPRNPKTSSQLSTDRLTYIRAGLSTRTLLTQTALRATIWWWTRLPSKSLEKQASPNNRSAAAAWQSLRRMPCTGRSRWTHPRMRVRGTKSLARWSLVLCGEAVAGRLVNLAWSSTRDTNTPSARKSNRGTERSTCWLSRSTSSLRLSSIARERPSVRGMSTIAFHLAQTTSQMHLSLSSKSSRSSITRPTSSFPSSRLERPIWPSINASGMPTRFRTIQVSLSLKSSRMCQHSSVPSNRTTLSTSIRRLCKGHHLLKYKPHSLTMS